MFSDFYLFHRERNEVSAEAVGFPDNCARWETCLREIGLAFSPSTFENRIDGRMFCSQTAYQFLLEVVCGLHSPIVGETEIMGQFRQRFLDSEIESPQMRRLCSAIWQDAKYIRQEFLLHLGSQSYGSLVRKMSRRAQTIHFVGYGQLVKSILPLLTKYDGKIYVHSRRAIDGKSLISRSLDSAFVPTIDENNLLVIAAPMTSESLGLWTEFEKWTTILDLRGESATDPLLLSANKKYLTLQDAFSEISNNQKLIAAKKARAEKEIQTLTEQRFRAVNHRPFGWDDVCA